MSCPFHRGLRDLFGIDDPVRYRNLIHLLYRLRRPTIGDRLEAGELVGVLSEALPPMDETVLDEVARNIADLEQAREEKAALTETREAVEAFLSDYHGYLVTALRERVAKVREQLDACTRRTEETEHLRSELDGLVTKGGTGDQIILPVWHNIDKEAVMAYSPSLADKVARSTADYSVEDIAFEVAELIRERKMPTT